SPPRRKRHDSDASPPRRQRHDSDCSPPRKGISDFGSQNLPGARPEKKMTTQEYLRARKFGKLKKETPEDLLRQAREAELQKKAQEKHNEWKKGVVQNDERKERIAEAVHEMGKSFARSAEDQDMNQRLKDVMREEDPMLNYIMKKKQREDGRPSRPLYQGSFPPNRFKIRPGYRWDGVDRSCGYEKDWFNRQNSKRAVDEESYKWSTEDM
ncbi:UNVERIFIED_CONTAM: hypothetical protein GTU68_010083, partial [Idotea baltica]|nr:hypothetical protein [Idotea baltica]